jgi:carbamoyltransferase
MNIISMRLFHDSAIALKLGERIVNVELERVFGVRYFSWRTQTIDPREVVALIRSLYGENEFDVGIIVQGRSRNIPGQWSGGEGLWRVGKWVRANHHQSHAAAAFFQSPFDRSLVISFDGGGEDGFFRFFTADRRRGVEYLGPGLPLNLGGPYAALGVPIREIRKSKRYLRSTLANAGKLMGLAAYGFPRSTWEGPIREFFLKTHFRGGARSYITCLPALGKQIGIGLEVDALSGNEACDLAATGQKVFEDLFLEAALPLVRQHKLPVCLSGGCALNVSANERFARQADVPVFVPPNPGDCGLPIGGIFHHFPPEQPVSLAYSGIPLLDLDELPALAFRYNAKKSSPEEVAELLAAGKIVAVARGGSEHGPRALGNRSILCDPGIPGIKDRLNLRIKFRESFRPYAPLVPKSEAARYFDSVDCDMSFMSFSSSVRPEWRQRLAGVTHEDGTARIQTVTPQQNPWLAALLAGFGRLAGVPVLLNTSFNSKGKPILTRISEVISILRSTEIDYVMIEDWLFAKQGLR